MSQTISWGVLSTAKIAREKVIPALQRGEFSRVDAIGSRDAAKAAEVAASLGIPKSYGSYEELLADPDIQVVYNALPNHLHVPWTLKALEAGKHVLCEKPVGLTADEAGRIAEAEARSGRIAAEAFMVRHHPQWRRAREIAASGAIGEVRAIQTFFSYFNADPENVRNKADIGGGALYDIGCYAIATARHIFDAEPERVVGLIDRDPAMHTDRLTSALAEFPGHRHLGFTCATQLNPHQRVTISGTKGRIEIQIPFNAPPSETTRLLVDDGRDLMGGGAVVEEFPPCDQYTLQGDAFSRVVLGQERLEHPIADAILNMRVIDALFRSAKAGGWEKP
ncbi:deoxyfructose oxidoreductase [Skermanella stibiiresistens SB22]|uniref:Deoxyfructose oxidoreductase n=1 Tax=Skermanella stibiiresistens SB22 TaxID=1385369 RepID=W9HAV7_9PROT|nr:Gfo/Idh/MocA family oxidoreductase [Skermanella stibiiresistens]EWY40993.1 deoxyfructose oxidoreductase [Skermanella stibiiresistens SB22]